MATQQAGSSERLSVKGVPKFDLEAYISNYTGRARINRLIHIGATSATLSQDALKTALAETKAGADIALYQQVVKLIQDLIPNDPDAVLDKSWMDETSRRVKKDTDKLEYELKGYKNNLIKESIRMGNEDLGSHYYNVGDLASAYKAYNRMRDYCTTPKHVIDMCSKLLLVSIDQANWMAVQSNALKIINSAPKPRDTDSIRPFLLVASGLAQLSSGNFKEAALNFLKTEALIENNFSSILTNNDVAVYGTLCALASMDRNELQQSVLENSTFRSFLELEPHLRRAVAAFVSGKYGTTLEILESYKTDYLLDYYLSSHIPYIYQTIRSKAIVLYFVPFSAATLSSMAAAFATTTEEIEQELVGLIEGGELDARIDLQQQLLVSTSAGATGDLRKSVHMKTLKMAEDYKRTAQLRLLRMNIMSRGLEVRAPKSQDALRVSAMQGTNGGMTVPQAL